MIPNLYIGNGCFTKHQFFNGCLGFQVWTNPPSNERFAQNEHLVIPERLNSAVEWLISLQCLLVFKCIPTGEKCSKKCTIDSWTLIQIPSLPNTSWEGVLGMFLGSKYFLTRCLEAERELVNTSFSFRSNVTKSFRHRFLFQLVSCPTAFFTPCCCRVSGWVRDQFMIVRNRWKLVYFTYLGDVKSQPTYKKGVSFFIQLHPQTLFMGRLYIYLPLMFSIKIKVPFM